MVCQQTTWLRRCAWPPSRRCRATRIRDDRSWPSSTASPHTRLLTPTAPRGATGRRHRHPAGPALTRGRSRADGDRLRRGGAHEQAAGDPAREAARNPDPARGRRHERRGDRRGRRQHRGRRARRPAPGAGPTEGRDSTERGATMPDFGRWTANGGDPSLNEINRADRFFDALAAEATGRTPTDHAEAELAFLLSELARRRPRRPDRPRRSPPRDAVEALHGGLAQGRRRTRTVARGRRIGGRGDAVHRRLRHRGRTAPVPATRSTACGPRCSVEQKPPATTRSSLASAAAAAGAAADRRRSVGAGAGQARRASAPRCRASDQVEQKQQLVEQWNALTYKVVEQDPAATLPPAGEPLPVAAGVAADAAAGAGRRDRPTTSTSEPRRPIDDAPRRPRHRRTTHVAARIRRRRHDDAVRRVRRPPHLRRLRRRRPSTADASRRGADVGAGDHQPTTAPPTHDAPTHDDGADDHGGRRDHGADHRRAADAPRPRRPTQPVATPPPSSAAPPAPSAPASAPRRAAQSVEPPPAPGRSRQRRRRRQRSRRRRATRTGSARRRTTVGSRRRLAERVSSEGELRRQRYPSDSVVASLSEASA